MTEWEFDYVNLHKDYKTEGVGWKDAAALREALSTVYEEIAAAGKRGFEPVGPVNITLRDSKSYGLKSFSVLMLKRPVHKPAD